MATSSSSRDPSPSPVDGTPESAPSGRDLGLRLKVFYSLPKLGVTAMAYLIQSYVRKYYVDTLQVAVSTIGIVIAICKTFDIFIDYGCGFHSDKKRARNGRRMPTLAMVSAAMCASFMLLAIPPSMSADASVIWFAAFYMLFYTVTYSTFLLLYMAVGFELSSDYAQRAQLFGIWGWVGGLSILISAGVTIVIGGMFPDNLGTQNTFGAILFTVIMVVAIALLWREVQERPTATITSTDLERNTKRFGAAGSVQSDHALADDDEVASVDSADSEDSGDEAASGADPSRAAPQSGTGTDFSSLHASRITSAAADPSAISAEASIALLPTAKTAQTASRKLHFVPSIRQMFSNSAFMNYTLARLPTVIGEQMPGGILIYYMQYVAHYTNPSQGNGYVLLFSNLVGLLGLYPIIRLSEKVGKARTLSAVMVITGCIFFFMGLLPPSVVTTVLLGAAVGAGQTAIQSLPPAVFADTVDYSELLCGSRLQAIFLAVEINILKFVEVPASAVPLFVLSDLGYVPNGGCACGCGKSCEHVAGCGGIAGNSTCYVGCQVQPGDGSGFEHEPCTWQKPAVATSMRWMFAFLPGILLVLSGLILSRFPITGKTHEQVIERIRMYRSGQQVSDPVTGKPVNWARLPMGPDHFYDWELNMAARGENVATLRRILAGFLLTWTSGLITAIALTVHGYHTVPEHFGITVIAGGALVSSLFMALIIWETLRWRVSIRYRRRIKKWSIRHHKTGWPIKATTTA